MSAAPTGRYQVRLVGRAAAWAVRPPAHAPRGRRGRAAPAGPSRLRATWLADCGELLGLATFMRAAGISCSQRLGDLVAGLEPGGEEQAVRLLGAARP